MFVVSYADILPNGTPLIIPLLIVGKGGKNRRRGKNENENMKRELVFKEDGQGRHSVYFP